MRFFGDPDGDYSGDKPADPERPNLETRTDFALRVAPRSDDGGLVRAAVTSAVRERDEQIATWLDAQAAWFTANECEEEAAAIVDLAKRLRGAK